jgi:FHA domain-containing protein
MLIYHALEQHCIFTLISIDFGILTMIRITVVSYNNLAPTPPISAVFGAERGSIGRSDDNFLVLPDPKHCVSRAQAQVWSDGTHHQLINISLANPILLNDEEIVPEREYDIHAGDQIRIGSYLLSVVPIESDELSSSATSPLNRPVTERRIKSTPAASIASKTRNLIQPPQYLLRKDGLPGYIQDMFPATESTERRLQPPPPAAKIKNQPMEEERIVQPPLFTSPALELPPSSSELLQAFLNGAGLSDLKLSTGLTPELMETMGKLVATSVKGTMDLISQRALVKREVNAEVTMVVLRKNNPLKFFPDSQTVLTQMLRKKMPGFMTPSEAMEDAFLDLRAHQLAVVVGMKAAMEALLKKLQPSDISNSLASPTLLDYLNPARRKAAMWDHFSELFDSISLESKNEIQSLFGKEFLAAYESEIDRIKHNAQVF